MKKDLLLEKVQALQLPLPPEALKPHPTKKYLTTINVGYVVERMNDVFGIGGWYQECTVIESTGSMIVMHSVLHVPEYNITIHTYGGNDNVDRGDAYKGAQTDALTKACSYLGIGLHVWKNETPQPGTPSPMRAREVTPAVEGGKTCPSCGLGMKFIPAGVSKTTGKEYQAFHACEQCKTKVSSKS